LSRLEHGRHEPGHHPVGQALHVGLGFLRPSNQLDHLGQGRAAGGARNLGD
jgi:hypothetical protein